MSWRRCYAGRKHGLHGPLLATFGLILTHMSVNSLNDYFDYRSGIDKVTNRTPFSGGSGMLKEGLLAPREVLLIGIITLLLAECAAGGGQRGYFYSAE